MALSNGPNLGVLFKGAAGEEHYDELMARWRAIDLLVMPCVTSANLLTPPGGSPADGDAYIIGRGDLTQSLAWTRSGSDITLTWGAHGLSVGHGFRVVTSSSTGAVALADFTVTTVTDADTIIFTGTAGGDASGTLTCFRLPYGTWATHVDKIARYNGTGAAWEYYTPKEGWHLGDQNLGQLIYYHGTAVGWQGLLLDLENNIRTSAIVNLSGLTTYTLTRTEATCPVLYIGGDQNCEIIYPATLDSIVPAYVFINTEFYGYTLSITQESSSNTYTQMPGQSKFYAYGEGSGMGDMLDGTKRLARAASNGVEPIDVDTVLVDTMTGEVLIVDTSAGAVTLTIDGSEAISDNALFRIMRDGANTLTIDVANGATVIGNTTPDEHVMVTLAKSGALDEWYCG